MIFGKKRRFKHNLKVGFFDNTKSDEVGLLGRTVDKTLNLRKHIESLCKTV